MFAQNLVIHFQLDTQIGNVLVNDRLVGSKASVAEENKLQIYNERTHKKSEINL